MCHLVSRLERTFRTKFVQDMHFLIVVAAMRILNIEKNNVGRFLKRGIDNKRLKEQSWLVLKKRYR